MIVAEIVSKIREIAEILREFRRVSQERVIIIADISRDFLDAFDQTQDFHDIFIDFLEESALILDEILGNIKGNFFAFSRRYR